MTVEVLHARDVPLGGLRAMTVRRSLPQRARTLIGAWCFVDHYGPDDVSETGGMEVPPHPHTGLQTVSWLFTGEIEHRDSLGKHAMVRPGEVNLMTGGRGICHSEVSTSNTTLLHGVQLWLALPAEHRDAPRDFQHYAPEPVQLQGAAARVFIGSLAGSTSPISTFTPLLGAELMIEPGATVRLAVDPSFEHGVMVDGESALVSGQRVPRGAVGYVEPGATAVTIANPLTTAQRVMLIGGTPYEEQFVMWWNFIGTDHDAVAQAREEWEQQTERFGKVAGYVGEIDHIPAPALPNARLRPRGNPKQGEER